MNGYVDPRIVPVTQRERALLAEVRKRGLMLHRCHAQGSAVRLTGEGVFVLATRLGDLTMFDLAPVRSDAEVRRLQGFVRRAEAPRRAAARV